MADKKTAESVVSVATKRKQFKWSSEMIDDLLNALENYRPMMELKGKNFDGDRNSQYTAIRKELCQKYEECFGPAELTKLQMM